MKDVQRIAIVDPSDMTREPLRNLLLGIESVWLEAECSRYEFFIGVPRPSSPDLVGVAVSSRGDGQSILQALRAGAKEFLTAPVVLEELLLALQRLRHSRGGGGTDS